MTDAQPPRQRPSILWTLGDFRNHLDDVSTTDRDRIPEVLSALNELDELVSLLELATPVDPEGDAVTVQQLVAEVGQALREKTLQRGRFPLVISLKDLVEEHFEGAVFGDLLANRSVGQRSRPVDSAKMPSPDMRAAAEIDPPTSRSLLRFAIARSLIADVPRKEIAPYIIALVFSEPHKRGNVRAPYSPESIPDVELGGVSLTISMMAYEREDRLNGEGFVVAVLSELEMYNQVRANPEISLDKLKTTVRGPRLTGEQVELGDVYGFLDRLFSREVIDHSDFGPATTQISNLIVAGVKLEAGLEDVFDFLDRRVENDAPPRDYELIAEILGTMALQWPAKFSAAFEGRTLRPSLANAVRNGDKFAQLVTTKVNGHDGWSDAAEYFAELARGVEQ